MWPVAIAQEPLLVNLNSDPKFALIWESAGLRARIAVGAGLLLGHSLAAMRDPSASARRVSAEARRRLRALTARGYPLIGTFDRQPRGSIAGPDTSASAALELAPGARQKGRGGHTRSRPREPRRHRLSTLRLADSRCCGTSSRWRVVNGSQARFERFLRRRSAVR